MIVVNVLDCRENNPSLYLACWNITKELYLKFNKKYASTKHNILQLRERERVRKSEREVLVEKSMRTIVKIKKYCNLNLGIKQLFRRFDKGLHRFFIREHYYFVQFLYQDFWFATGIIARIFCWPEEPREKLTMIYLFSR